MPDEVLWIDHASDATGSPLQIGMGTAYALTAQSYPAPQKSWLSASSADTEGSIPVSGKYENREIRLELEFVDPTGSLLATLQQKVAKLQEFGGTLRRTYVDGTTIRLYDLLDANGWDPVYDLKFYLGDLVAVQLTLPGKPLARGAEVDLGDNVTTTEPCLIFTETSPGDVKALGRLVVDEDQGQDQQWVTYGVETDAYYTFTDSTGSGALWYGAESRTPMGTAATAVGPAGAHGAGSNVVRTTSLPTDYEAVLSTQASGGGAHLTHRGTFRVYARMMVATTNTGVVSVALQWSHGDFRSATTNSVVTMSEAIWVNTASWRLVDLGLVSIPLSASQWEGRIVAKSTVSGDDLDIDYLMLVPGDWASGIVGSVVPTNIPTSFSARDSFDQTAGALAGKTLPIGGTWAGAGDADDFTVNATAHTAQRTALSDTGTGITTGRWGIAGTATFSNVTVQATLSFAATAPYDAISMGVFARYTDTANWLAVELAPGNVNSFLTLIKSVAGTRVVLDTLQVPGSFALLAQNTAAPLRLQADDQGRVFVWFNNATTPTLETQHADLATGGALASGKAGIVDWCQTAFGSTRTFNNFAVWVPVKDAAMFASQSLEISHAGARRENSTGTYWVDKTVVGDYLRLPPSGAEGRALRVIVKACRNDPATLPDSGIDDISARLFATPRYIT